MRLIWIGFMALVFFDGPAAAQIPTARDDVLAAERARPDDPWPRGRGHVVLALPGTLESAKAYHEPGGSFSPEFGSFGVSLWITNSDGSILETSDSIPMARIHQNFVWRDRDVTPSIRTVTDRYVAEWSVGPSTDTSRLHLHPKVAPGQNLMLVIRSVGPAGSAIESLRGTGRGLVINDRYIVEIAPRPVATYVGSEKASNWTNVREPVSKECHGQRGWCYARVEMPRDREATVRIVDTFPLHSPQLAATDTRSGLDIDLPDQRFAESLDAQVAHLMMGPVGNQTRPGDPNQYPLPWLRDGAYQLVALAHAGRLDTARELGRYFAEHDFFGGFGAEGDNPGLSLWAIGEVASLSRDPKYDQYLWPHVYRKAEFILGMQATRVPIQRIFAGPIVPIHRAQQGIYTPVIAAKDGLIEGSMDLGYHALNATAVSYAGLLSAAAIADQLKHTEEAARWRAAATKLQDAWNGAFVSTDDDTDVYLSGVWPTWVASDGKKFKSGLDRLPDNVDWDPGLQDFKHIPEWTYFTFSYAHQYLILGQSARAWQTLVWFWNHQTSPGLYSWWEGSGEENNFHQWEYVRGWVDPPHVTPHYWSAAQCLLLQLDMLAYIDKSSPKLAIMIGAGLPTSWSTQPMHVHGMETSRGRVDWDWDGKAMTVKLQGDPVAVHLGAGFPSAAKMSVLFTPAAPNP